MISHRELFKGTIRGNLHLPFLSAPGWAEGGLDKLHVGGENVKQIVDSLLLRCLATSFFLLGTPVIRDDRMR